MSSKFDVCVRGGGVVGLTTALLLARERLRVALVAPATGPDPVRDIRAYALNTASRAVLDTLRAWPPGDAATPMTAMRIREGLRTGEIAAELRRSPLTIKTQLAAIFAKLNVRGRTRVEALRNR